MEEFDTSEMDKMITKDEFLSEFLPPMLNFRTQVCMEVLIRSDLLKMG